MSKKFACPKNIHRRLTDEEKETIRSDWEKRDYDVEFIEEDKMVLVTKNGNLITKVSYSYYTYYCQFIGL